MSHKSVFPKLPCIHVAQQQLSSIAGCNVLPFLRCFLWGSCYFFCFVCSRYRAVQREEIFVLFCDLCVSLSVFLWKVTSL